MVRGLGSGGRLDSGGRCRLLLAVAAHDRAQPTDGGAQDLEVLAGAGELALAAFAIVEAHGVLDGVDLLEDLGDRLPQVVFARASGHIVRYGNKDGTMQGISFAQARCAAGATRAAILRLRSVTPVWWDARLLES